MGTDYTGGPEKLQVVRYKAMGTDYTGGPEIQRLSGTKLWELTTLEILKS